MFFNMTSPLLQFFMTTTSEICHEANSTTDQKSYFLLQQARIFFFFHFILHESASCQILILLNGLLARLKSLMLQQEQRGFKLLSPYNNKVFRSRNSPCSWSNKLRGFSGTWASSRLPLRKTKKLRQQLTKQRTRTVPPHGPAWLQFSLKPNKNVFKTWIPNFSAANFPRKHRKCR